MKVCDCCKAENVCEFSLPILMKNPADTKGPILIGLVKVELCRSCAEELSDAYFDILRKHDCTKVHGEYLGGYHEGDAAF